jgi:hypothetical protein
MCRRVGGRGTVDERGQRPLTGKRLMAAWLWPSRSSGQVLLRQDAETSFRFINGALLRPSRLVVRTHAPACIGDSHLGMPADFARLSDAEDSNKFAPRLHLRPSGLIADNEEAFLPWRHTSLHLDTLRLILFIKFQYSCYNYLYYDVYHPKSQRL